jgi:hypothetical protein
MDFIPASDWRNSETRRFQDSRSLDGLEIELRKKILSSFVYVTNIYGELGIMKTDRQNNGAQNHW